ncbi:hypothetical protein B0T22DRAFT_382781 [Podospora appendiculata]|uniref:F-box domain-containing protein n=1 Tax=Podospora appendiculata TaxID=314037 RepID=A0AAE1CAQ1_9PEZI|nr:hypothetical protein B0T22DRAFT_382781 [Podospora appendiculata]
MSLVQLPYELLSYVVQALDLATIRSLSLTCRRFLFLFQEPNIAKLLLETKAPETQETRNAKANKRWAVELRRLVKRREAISSVSPFLVALVGYAETWLYENGVLCYIKERQRCQLRILELHRSQSSEIIVDTQKLLGLALPISPPKKYRFQLLYCAHNIVSCLYTHKHPEPASWLIFFDPWTDEIIQAQQLDSSYKIFVRNNDKFLFYGTHSQLGHDGFRRWEIKGYDLEAKTWLPGKLDLTNFVGVDIGSGICFEILDDWFYALSNQTAFEVDEIDSTSNYDCYRFPLNRQAFQNLEHIPRAELWRRQHADGAIDDRWTFMRLFKDEATARIKVVESRKEWLAGNRSATRTYYTKEIHFSAAHHEQNLGPGPGGTGQASSLPDIGQSASAAVAVDKCLGNYPNSADAPSRDPHLVHPGDDGSKALMFTLSKCPIRSYHPSCQTFIDLVDDPPDFNQGSQRIRIRGGSRRPWSPDEREERLRSLAADGQEPPSPTLYQQLHNIYRHDDVVLWPPEQDPGNSDPHLDRLYGILNPPDCLGRVEGVWDERSMVYATGDGESGDLKCLVFVSWDPSIFLKGTPPYPGALSPGGSPLVRANALEVSRELESWTAQSYEGKGKGKDTAKCDPISEPKSTCNPKAGAAASLSTSSSPGGPAEGHNNHNNGAQWKTVGPAEYQKIARGYHFAAR